MKVQGLSEKAMQFQLDEKHYNIPIASKSGVLIHFVEIDDLVRVMIEVGEDTTSRDLRGAIPLALAWRDRLLEWQGPWMSGGNNPFLDELCYRQEAGESYSKLVERINQKVAALLQEYGRYVEEYESAKSQFVTMLDFYMWQPRANQFSLEHARNLLRAVKMKDGEIDTFLRYGFENVRAGKPPFEKGYPVSREKLIGTLRSWRQGLKHKIQQEHDLGSVERGG